MSKPIIVPFAALSLLLAACSADNTTAGPASGEEGAAPAAEEGATPASQAGKAREVSEETELYSFDYSYPAEADALPELRALLDKQLDELRSSQAADAAEAQESAKRGDYPYRPYGSGKAWKVVTELPGWLSLSAQLWAYTGGAHPNSGFDSLLWDKIAKTERKVMDLFVSPAALSEAIRAPFCDQIDKQRAEKRGSPVNRASGDQFDECIDPASETVILGSSDRKHFNRIGVLVGPYSAGPYVEGSYEATVPVTQAVLDAVKPEYRQFFALAR